MSNYNTLKATINANIKQNGNQEITGQILNSVLNQMVTTLGAGYQFAGLATTATNPGTPDAKVFYIANGKGTYTNFSGLEVTEDEVVVLYYDTEWHKVATGIASQAKLAELENSLALKLDIDARDTNVIPQEGNIFTDIYDYYTTYAVGVTYKNRTSATQMFNVIRTKIRGVPDIVRVFIFTEEQYANNHQGAALYTADWDKIYEGNNLDRITLDNIINLPVGSSIAVIAYSQSKNCSYPIWRDINNDKGYAALMGLDNADESSQLIATTNEYCCIPPELTFEVPFVRKEDLNNNIDAEIAKFVREIVNITNDDDEFAIMNKFLYAYKKGNCDVIFEGGEYVLKEIYPYINTHQSDFGQGWGLGLPIGNNCRYYFNGSTIISEQPTSGELDSRHILNACGTAPHANPGVTNFELYDAILINKSGKYCIHDEGNSCDNSYKHIYNNIKFVYDSTNGTPNDGGFCFGCGTGFNCIFEFVNCSFYSGGDNSYTMIFHGCADNVDTPIRMSVVMNNCYANQSIEISEALFNHDRDIISMTITGCKATLIAGTSIAKYLFMLNNEISL